LHALALDVPWLLPHVRYSGAKAENICSQRVFRLLTLNGHETPIETWQFRHYRIVVRYADKPRFRAMFETCAEVMGGLVKALRDYQQKSEKAGEAKQHNKKTRP
jgi:hypothetical protein